MKATKKWLGLIVPLVVVLAAGTILAQQPPGKVSSQADKLLSDLTITNIYFDGGCGGGVAVVVKNLGPGPLPDTVWTVHTPQSAGVYLYKNGVVWDKAPIWSFDPAKNLKNPGGTAIFTSTLKVTKATIKAVVDPGNVVKEANEGNNSLEVNLACGSGGTCCLGGTYDGVKQDTASATCTHPSTEKFILTIDNLGCSHVVNGEVETIKGGVPTHTYHFSGSGGGFTGTCCVLDGKLLGIAGTATANEEIKFKGTLCDIGGKWYCKDGVYSNPTGCSGNFRLQQK
jgi:CARDB